jgi:hypothetical protein
MRKAFKISIFFLFSLIFLSISALPQITVQSPSAKDIVKACPDFTDEVLLNRWDMNERTDLGWRIFNTVELPLSYLTDISFQNGIFSGKSVYTDGFGSSEYSAVNIEILESVYPGASDIGKNGRNFPIDADKYTIFAMRMSLSPESEGKYGRLWWARDTMYGEAGVSNFFDVYNNWAFYAIDLPSLGIQLGTIQWDGWIRFLRLHPIFSKDRTIKLDWIRLVQYDASSLREIRWSGNSGNVDIYLDNDNNPANGNLGLLAKNVSGTSHSFLAGALMAGDYYVAIAPAGTTSFSYSSGYYSVNDAPLLKFTKPSEEGSDVDFATVTFSDPWDMNNSEDVEHTVLVKNARFATIDYEDLAGNVYANRQVYLADSEPAVSPNVGDPHVFFLHFLHRGMNYPIDSSKYHNLVVKMGLAGTHSTNDGSILRVVYKNQTESVENVSMPVVIRHLPGRWVMHKVVCDLRTLPLTPGDGSPSHTGWTGKLDCFRLDPHEFSEPREFFFDEIRLTADWTANASFTIEWTLSDVGTSSFVSLYYDTDSVGYNGTLIASNIPASPGAGSYTWDTSSIPEGKYWIYAVVDDGINQNRSYAGGAVIIDQGLIPEIKLSKTRIYLGAQSGGPSTSKEEVLITNVGQGALNWQAVPSVDWIDVTPSAGTGNGVIQVGLKYTSLSPGSYTGTIKIEDAKAWNSPQMIEIYLTVYGTGGNSGPFGHFDTPAEGAAVFGSVPVTGWALDDIEVVRVEVKRSPHVLDNPIVIGPDGLVFIGNAVFVEGARPDVANIYPTYPLNSRAGWGYMLLTNMLPNYGNGSYTLYAVAYDKEGNSVTLGSKTISCNNADSKLPFGAIDTPAQGGTASGLYTNFGWALTPQPNMIPTDGSTINVWVDGVAIGRPVYNNYRSDIANKFPGYANTDGAVGYYYLDTTAYANGVHTIAWSVVDSGGNATGIGSRFFTIFNSGSGMARVQGESVGTEFAGMEGAEGNRYRLPAFRHTPLSWAHVISLPVSFEPLTLRKGYVMNSEPEVVFPDSYGVVTIVIPEVERVEVDLSSLHSEKYPWLDSNSSNTGQNPSNLPQNSLLSSSGKGGNGDYQKSKANTIAGINTDSAADRQNLTSSWTQGYSRNKKNPGYTSVNKAKYSGYLIVNNELHPLPIGSTLDEERGIFYWQPGPGFLGAYDFVFVRESTNGSWKKTYIKVKIVPKF